MSEENQITVDEIVSRVESIIKNRPYSKNYGKDLGYDFRRFQRYCNNHKITYYSPEIGDAYLHDECGIPHGIPSKKCTHAQRVINMLTEYQRLGVVVPRRTKGRTFPEQFLVPVNGYMEKLRREFKRPQTLMRVKTILLKFTEYLEQNSKDNLALLSADDINCYYKKCLNNYGRKYVQDNVNVVKRFLHYLYETNIIPSDISAQIMEIHCGSAPKNLPDTFSDEDIEKILSAVDRESPMGKRDYAIMLVAARLGLRQSDIKNLSLANLDWDNMTVNFVQVKTKKSTQLPLPMDVGWAIIEYLKIRPQTDAPEIFVRCNAPYEPLNNYNWMLSKYMRIAGIRIDGMKHHGFHTFRHSLATRLLKSDIPVTTIKEVMGHESPATTMIYTSVDQAQLSQCSLEVPAL